MERRTRKWFVMLFTVESAHNGGYFGEKYGLTAGTVTEQGIGENIKAGEECRGCQRRVLQ